MAIMKIADLAVVPETFLELSLEASVEKSALFQAGVANSVALEMPKSGKIVHMPFFTDLAGDSVILSDSAELSINKVSEKDMMAAIHFRGTAFGANELVGALAGTDPMAGMIAGVGGFWAREYNKIALASLKGAVNAAGEGVGFVDISDHATAALQNINVAAAYDAQQLLGDSQDSLQVYVMHSAVRNYLRQVDAASFDFVPNSQNVPTETYLGKRIIVDDSLTPATGVYTTFLLATGALSFADGTDPRVNLEIDRNKLTGEDYFTSRRRFALTVNGCSFDSASVVGISPTLAELATAGNWDLAVNAKNQRAVALKHKINAA